MAANYLVALAYHARPGSPRTPSDLQLTEFGRELAHYHPHIERQLGFLPREELMYVAVLASLASGRTTVARADIACRFFASVRPRVPVDSLLAAGGTLSASRGARARTAATRRKSAAKTSSKRRKAAPKRKSARKTAARSRKRKGRTR